MTVTIKTKSTSSRYILLTLIAAIVTWILHEFAHWLAGTLLGYKMGMGLNQTFPYQVYDTDRDYQLISAAGPAFTLLQAVVIFIIMQRKKIISLYPFLFTCFYMRLLAAMISILNPNDEARISKEMGWGTYTLPVIVVAFLFFLVYKISGKYHLGGKFNMITLGWVILFSSVIILTDQFFHIRLL